MNKKKARIARIPLEAWEGFYKKQQSLQQMLKEDLNINKRFPMTDVFRFFSQKQTLVYPDEIKWYLNSKKKRRLI